MCKYKYGLIFLLTITSPLYGTPICDSVINGSITQSLSLNGLMCSPKKTGSCHYTECVGRISGYSKDVVVVVPEIVNRLRVHFHGHYVKEPKKIPSTFNLVKTICNQKEAVFFPTSSGKCDDFDRELIDEKTFKDFFNGIHNASGSHMKKLPLHISAHSGGGRTVARLLNSGTEPEEVTVFDAIYDDEQRDSYKKWYDKGTGNLNLFMATGGPSEHARKLLKDIGQNPRPSWVNIQRKDYKVRKGPRFQFLERLDRSGSPHNDVVSETWPLTP